MCRWLLLTFALSLSTACHHYRMTHGEVDGSEPYTAWGLEEGRTKAEMRYRIRWDPASELTPVALIHGNFDDLETWDRLVTELPQDVPLVLLEIPGFGETPALEASGPVEHADAIAAALEELELPPVVLGGHSLGGMLAAHVAQHHPEQVAHLVLIGAGFIDPRKREDLPPKIGRVMDLAETHGVAAEGVEDPLFEPVRELLLDAVHKDERIDDQLVRAYEERVVACLGSAARLVGDGWTLPAPPAEVPVTGIYGWHDRWVSVTNATAVGESNERRLFLLKNSGHLPQLEQPLDVASILGALAGRGDLASLEPCLGEGLIDPAVHPWGTVIPRYAFDGEYPVSCVGEPPPTVEEMDCEQLAAACVEEQEPACARLIEEQREQLCDVQACEAIGAMYEESCFDGEDGEACFEWASALLFGLCGYEDPNPGDIAMIFNEGCLFGHQPSCEAKGTVHEVWEERRPSVEHRGGLL
jgi:pimeloyl-ACP methyl ester carboxylesterase